MAVCTTRQFGTRRATRVGGARFGIGAAGLLLVLNAAGARAGTYTTTVQSVAATSSDSYLKEENKDENRGGDQDMRLKQSSGGKYKNLVVSVPLPALAGKSVLQAWLSLYQSATADQPVQAYAHALSESWTETGVTWKDRNRAISQAWSTSGGSRLPAWTSRRTVSAATNNTRVTWQVGPVVSAWNLGDLPNNGFLIRSGPGPDKEFQFRTSEYTSDPTKTPQLSVRYTDEPPAIRSGVAEIQPSQVLKGVTNLPWAVWLNVAASGTTPSGPATGFDLITVDHQGALRGRSLDSLVVGGTAIPLNQVTWSDNGTSITLRIPRVTTVQVVRAFFHIDVLAAQASEIPIYVDDTATTGVDQQVLWPGNADGIADNGDTWELDPSLLASALRLEPDSIMTTVGQCRQFILYAMDDKNNEFTVAADNYSLYNLATNALDPTIGTVDASGIFCAKKSGTGYYLIAGYANVSKGEAYGYSALTINAAVPPVFSSLTLRNRGGTAVTSLAPQDTMLLDAVVSDGNGFKDIDGLDFTLSFAGHANDANAPAYHATYRWRRGSPTPFTLVDPTASTWALVPALCSIDTTTNSTSAQVVRLAFRPGVIARASSTGEWTARVVAFSNTPVDSSTSFSRTGLGAVVKLTAAWDDSAGAFNAGSPGATLLPLRSPTDGKVDLRFVVNTSYDVEAKLSDLAGLTSTSDTLRVGSPTPRVSWAFNSSRTGGGRLDTAYGIVAAARPAPTSEIPIAENLYLWIDLPSTTPPQDYRGTLKVRLAASGVRSAEPSIPLTATVTTAGLAAQAVVGEVLPDSVQVGVSSQAFTAYVLPTFSLFDTGIDRIWISIPDGYGVPTITNVKVGGSAVSYTDASQLGILQAQLASRIGYSVLSRLVEIQFRVSTPVDLDSTGSNFVVQFDDASTTRPPEVAAEGNANGIADRNDWRVVVTPGPMTAIRVSPDSTTLYTGESQSFTALATDAYGHAVPRTIGWSTQGGIGTISSSGLFTATAVGSGLVIATSGSLSATAPVTVRPTRGIRIAGLTAPTLWHQGQDSISVGMKLVNLGTDSLRLDQVALRFTRLIPGDVNGDYVVSQSADAPRGIGGRDTVAVTFLVRVSTTASIGIVSIDGSATATELATGLAVYDGNADAPVNTDVKTGGISVTATQVPAAVLPGAQNTVVALLTVQNHYPDIRTLRSLRLTNRSSGSGVPDQDQLDQELGEVGLYKDDGDGVLESGADSLLASTITLSGSVTFSPLVATIPATNGVLHLLVTSSVPLTARDGDSIDVSLDDESSVGFLRTAFFRTSWPLRPAGVFVVDGMAAEQVKVVPGLSTNLLAGSPNNPALELIVPPNGYRPDVLQRLAVVNFGNAEPTTDISRLRAWVDDGDSTFDAGSDRLLGDLVNTGDRWQRTGLFETIPLEGLRLYFTVDLSDLARQGRTVQLGIPFGLDAGLGVQSGNSGPRDKAVRSLVERAVSTVDRITLTSAVVESSTVSPGQRRVLLHHFIATNSYAQARTLSSIVFTNGTLGPGTTDERDGEIESATLRIDGDGDGALGDLSIDRALGTSFFSGGRAEFTGFAALIPAGSAVHFFLVADVARSGARDGDVLSAKVSGQLDVGFQELTTITAAWPVDSRARAAINGMIAAQITNLGAPGVTLGPGDGPALAMTVVVPWNGYRADILRNMAFVNLGSSTEARDIQELRLWADGGDGAFSAGSGDDRDLGALSVDATGQLWRSAFLSEAVGAAGSRLFVSLRTRATAADSVTVLLAIPFGGVQMESGNDGPLDAPVENAQPILISTSPLLASLETSAASSTIGQAITVRMTVRNAGLELVTGITPTALQVTGTAGAVLDGAPTGSIDLDPAEIHTFTWTYHSTSPGDVRFAGGAQGTGDESGVIRRAVETVSNVHRVYLAAADLSLYPVQSMPSNVTRGQTGVVPFSLTLTNGGGAGASDIRLRSFRLRLEDESGAGVIPADLLTRVSVNEGTNVYLSRSSLETSGSEINLTLASPLLVTGQEPVTISVRFDISDSTTTPAFRVVVVDSTVMVAEDATSGAPVRVRREDGAFPVRSGLAFLAADATELHVESLGGAGARVARGAQNVTLATLQLENVGAAGITSDVQLSEIGVTIADTSGVPLTNAASYVKRIYLRNAVQTFASQSVPGGAGPNVTLVLSPPFTVPAGTPLEVTLSGDVADTARIGTFRIKLQPPAAVDARDANTRDSVLVTYATTPVTGAPVLIEASAQVAYARGFALMPSPVLAGDHDVAAMRIVLHHPGTPGTGRVRLDSLLVQVRDETRTPRIPDDYLDRLRVLLDGVEVANLAGLPDVTGPIRAPLGGAFIEAGDSATLTLIVDLSPSAPVSFLELAVGSSGIRASDANTGAAVRVDPEPGVDFPLLSGLARITSPARDLFTSLQTRMPAALAVDGREVTVALLTLRNAAPAGAGLIRVDRLRFRASSPRGDALAIGSAARYLRAYVNGVAWARSDSLAVDSTETTLLGASTLEMDGSETVTVELRLVPQPSPSAGAFRLGIDAEGVGVIQPGSALLTVQVSPEGGSTFPFWTEAGSFTPASLAASWGNFPNPFAAGRTTTSFVYYLGSDANVTLRIWTPNGDRVATLLDTAARAAGLHESDVWNGRNGRGDVVRNGVYVAELIVQYADGTSERVRRKVAVVR